MSHQIPAVVQHLHALGWLEVRIEFGVADLPDVDTGEGRKTLWETAVSPQRQPAGAERCYGSRDDLGATVAVSPKADRILDETVGSPSQQETSIHKRRGHQGRRRLA